MKKSILFAFVMAASLGAWAIAQTRSAPARSDTVVIEYGLVSAFDQVQVPGREPGVLMFLDPKTSREGTEVQKGDILGELDNSDALAKKAGALAEVETATAAAESTAELDFAVASKKVSEAELQSFKDANKRSPGSISNTEIRRAQLQVERAGFEIELRKVEKENARRTIKIKQAQLDAAENELKRRLVTAPLDGVVVERMKHVGEWVQPGETILKIVRFDRLRVEGMVPAYQYSPQEVAGAKVTVWVETPDGDPVKAEGVIEYVNPVVEASGEYRVWTEIENRREGKHWVFRPGTVAKMEITLQGDAKRPAPPRKVSSVRGGQ